MKKLLNDNGIIFSKDMNMYMSYTHLKIYIYTCVHKLIDKFIVFTFCQIYNPS